MNEPINLWLMEINNMKHYEAIQSSSVFYKEKAFRQIHEVTGCSLMAHPLSHTIV